MESGGGSSSPSIRLREAAWHALQHAPEVERGRGAGTTAAAEELARQSVQRVPLDAAVEREPQRVDRDLLDHTLVGRRLGIEVVGKEQQAAPIAVDLAERLAELREPRVRHRRILGERLEGLEREEEERTVVQRLGVDALALLVLLVEIEERRQRLGTRRAEERDGVGRVVGEVLLRGFDRRQRSSGVARSRGRRVCATSGPVAGTPPDAAIVRGGPARRGAILAR